MPEKKMNPASLENLKKGRITRKKNKVQCCVRILPETREWLSRGGSISLRIDEIVQKIISGELIHRPKEK